MGQFAVIGLGNFGSYLGTRLYEKGHEVLAIDKDPAKVQAIKDRVSYSVNADTTDRVVLETLGLKQMDAVAVCIGTEMTNSILTTLCLKDVGVRRIIAMAISEAHGRILEKVGASEVVFPEKDLGISIAERLHNPSMLDYLPFTPGYSIMELAPPKDFVGKALRDLDLINRFGIQVVAIKEVIPDRVNMIPTGQFVIKDSDILIVLGPNESLERLRIEGR